MDALRLSRTKPLPRRQRQGCRLPVYGECGKFRVREDAPRLLTLFSVLRLVQQLRRKGQFIGINLDARYCFQTCCQATCAEVFDAEILDTVFLTTEATQLTRKELGTAVRAAYTGRHLSDVLCGCVWSCHQLGRSFAE